MIFKIAITAVVSALILCVDGLWRREAKHSRWAEEHIIDHERRIADLVFSGTMPQTSLTCVEQHEQRIGPKMEECEARPLLDTPLTRMAMQKVYRTFFRTSGPHSTTCRVCDQCTAHIAVGEARGYVRRRGPGTMVALCRNCAEIFKGGKI